MMDFKAFKEQRKSMAETLSKLRTDNTNNDSNEFWYPVLDKNQTAYAVIRILPQKDIAKHPVRTSYTHRYKAANGKNLWMLCPSTFGTMKDCPLCQIASAEYKRLHDNGVEKPTVPAYRKASSVVNIYVRKDVTNPENEGKVFKFRLPFQLQNKIENKLFPPKDKNGELMRNPEMIHDLWEGRDIIMDVKKNKLGYMDYNSCEFDSEKTPLAKTEAEIEAIYNQIYDIEPDKKSLPDPETMVEKWNNFMSLNHEKTLDESSDSIEKEIQKKQEVKAKERALEESLEQDFSFDSTKKETTIQNDIEPVSSDDESLPWD